MLLMEEEVEHRPMIYHGAMNAISETCRNEVDIGGNKRGRFTKFGEQQV